MDLTFVPQVRWSPLVYAEDGDAIIVNGQRYDFGPLLDGETLPRDAVGGDWLASDVTREGDTLRLVAVEPNPHPEWSPEPGEPGEIDWARKRSAAGDLDEWRASASLPVADFALAAMASGLVTPEEAEGWACGKALPAIADAALATLPDAERVPARIRSLASQNVHRTHPLIALIAAHNGLTDAQVDALFGAPI